MKKLLVSATALIFSFSGFSQAKEMSFNSGQNDLSTSSVDFNMKSDFNFDYFEAESRNKKNVEVEDEEAIYGWRRGDLMGALKFGYNSSTQGDEKDSNFSLVPCFGAFISDKWEIGGELGYKSSRIEFDGNDTEKTSTFKAGAYGRYYCEPQERFSTFGGLHVNYRTMKYDIADYSENGFEVAVDLGLNYFLNENWVLTTSIGALGYETSKPDFDGAESRNTFFSAFNMKRARVGLAYKFGNRLKVQ